MPDLRNDLPEPDHDRLIDISARVVVVEKEIRELRDWRHDQAAPVMMAIQAQQKANVDAISKVTENVSRLADAVLPLAELPAQFHEHKEDDEKSFFAVNTGIDQIHKKINTARDETAKDIRTVITWVAGLLLGAAATIIMAQWALLSTHIR